MDITKLSAENIDKLTPEQRAEIIKFYLEKRAAAAAEKQQQTPQIATESPFSFSPQPQVLPEPPKPVQEPKKPLVSKSTNKTNKLATKKRGPAPKPLESQRKHRIAVYLNHSEMKIINGFSELSKVCPAAYLRKTALNSPPTVIPELNQQVWAELSKAAANLNQLSKSINSNDIKYLDDARAALIRFRQALVEPSK